MFLSCVSCVVTCVGAINAFDTANSQVSTFIIEDNIFTDNKAGLQGSAIRIFTQSSNPVAPVTSPNTLNGNVPGPPLEVVVFSV